MAIAIDDLADLERRLPGLLRRRGSGFVELHTGLAEQTPMTVREHRRSISSSTMLGWLLRPRASATASA